MPVNLRTRDPHGHQKKETFDTAITFAGGSMSQLARMLGLPPSALHTCAQQGQLSPMAAVMAARSSDIGRFFTASDFRPDLTPEVFLKAAASAQYKETTVAQDAFQETPEFKDYSVARLLVEHMRGKHGEDSN